MLGLNKQFKSPKLAYMGYLFQTFLKRPFGYIIAVLYIVYLAVILVIVPSALHFAPLFIWNIGGFNMPIFNLYFIAASAASIAVAVFRTGRDDGSDLTISAKPLTKGTTVGIKTAVYLLIMIAVCLITLIIVALVMPVFGAYNEVTNITGIEPDKYSGLVLSVLVGNLVNMLFFGGISVFISMVGGQVITIIGTIAVVFVMCIMNFLYPQVVSSSISILSEKYNAEMLSFSCNTLSQFNDANAKPLNFATIQCSTDDSGDEEYHFDTKTYWDIAEKESGRKATNYIDFGKQLSSLYSSFGLDQSKLKEASKLVIGTNNSFVYDIDKTTHVGQQVIGENNYPICFYTITSKLGKSYPVVNVIGGDMSLTTSNWYLYTTLFGIDFDSMNYVSISADEMNIPNSVWDIYSKPWNRMRDLIVTDDQKTAAINLYNNALAGWPPEEDDFSTYAHNQIVSDVSGKFFEQGKYDDLSSDQKYLVTAKIQLIWAIQAHEWQKIQLLTDDSQFPTSKRVADWYAEIGDNEKQNSFGRQIFTKGILIDDNEMIPKYSRLNVSNMEYAETFTNLYQYTVSSFYKTSVIVAVWSIVSCILFGSSIIVYKRTDFK